MIPYRVKYTESEYDIQNTNILYEIDQKHQNTFEFLENQTISNFYFVLCINCIIHILYFWNFCKFGIFGIFIFIYITRVGPLHV